VRVRTFGKSSGPDGVTVEARADINSYPKVPFVDLHAVFESRIDTAVFSRWFYGKVKEDDRWDFSRYSFDYPRGKLKMEIGRFDTVISSRETLSVSGPMQDGLSLFFFARDQLMSRKQVNVAAIVKEQKVNTVINFIGERTSVEIDAVDFPVDVLRFEGNAQFTGIFGLTGDFEGWFSNDDARVPILAKMKVILGSITIELMQWKRTGWAPPPGQG